MMRFLKVLLLAGLLTGALATTADRQADAQTDAGTAQPAEGAETPSEAVTIPPPAGATVPRGTAGAAGGSISAAGSENGGDKADDDGSESEIETGLKLWQAVRSGEWGVAVGLAIVLLVAGLRTVVLGSWIPWFKTRLGGYVLAFATGAGVIIGPSLAAGTGLSLGLVGAALSAGWAAIGMHLTYKDAKAKATGNLS